MTPSPSEPRLPSPSFVRATATLAADLALGLDDGGDTRATLTTTTPCPHIATALDLTLEAAEAAVATVWQAGDDTSTGGRALALASALARAAPPLLVAAAAAGVDASLDASERVHALMRSAARLADEVGDGEDGAVAWTWSIDGGGEDDDTHRHRHLSSSTTDPAEALTDALSCALTAALASAWASGPSGREQIKAALVPLADLDAGGGASPTEQQAELLTAGRLAARLAGDADLLAVAVPLLSESGVAHAAPAARAAAAHVSACLAAVAAAGRGGVGWAYDAQVDALVKAYKAPDGVGGPLLHQGAGADGVPPPTAGALASALATLTRGLASASAPVRRDALVRLLALFADVGATTRVDDAPAVADLAALLPAIASVADAAWTGGAAGAGAPWTDAERVEGGTAPPAAPTTPTEPRLHAATDADVLKSFRLLWLYVGVHGLAGVTGRGAPVVAGVAPGPPRPSLRGAGATTPAPTYLPPSDVVTACGAIAAVTPQLAVLGDGDTAKLTAELGPRVDRLGPAAATRAAATIARLLGGAPAGAAYLGAGEPAVRTLHILSVATLELARVELAPLGRCVAAHDGAPVPASPLDALLDALQDVEPGLWASPWLSAIVDAAAASYCGRLATEGKRTGRSTARGAAPCAPSTSPDGRSLSPVRGRWGGDGVSAPRPPSTPTADLVTPALEKLAANLVAASARGGGAPNAPGSPARMLASVLARFPSLHWRPVLLQAALAAVDSQEAARVRAAAGATGGGGVASHPGLDLVLRVVAEAARDAPAHAEALLHEPLRGGVRMGVASADGDAPALALLPTAAIPAALRHAADLMAALDAARPASVDAADTSEGPIAGVEALSRKSYYGGAAAARAAAGPGGVADAAAALRNALDSHASSTTVDDRVLACAAAVATAPTDAAAPTALRTLASVPARRLRPATVRVCCLAWEWVAAAAPALRVPLVAAVAAGWLATVDAQAGLFSRAYDADAVHMGAGGDPDDHVELTRGVKAHAAWLEYWDEVWQVRSGGGGFVGRARRGKAEPSHLTTSLPNSTSYAPTASAPMPPPFAA